MRSIALGLAVALIAGAAAAQVRVVGSPGSLNALVDSQQMVTVVLRAGARDPNLRIESVGHDYFSVRTETGQVYTYRFNDVQEVRVQETAVTRPEFQFQARRALRADEQQIVNRAQQRAREVFAQAEADQMLRMDAAALLAHLGEPEAKQYLVQLAEGNDLLTALEASLRLFASGDATTAAAILPRASESGDRRARALFVRLVGVTNQSQYWNVVNTMLRDRDPELSAPAGRAAAQMGRTESVPSLVQMLMGLNEARAEAGVYGLTRLGGDAVIQALKSRIEEANDQQLFRMAKVLHALGDPEGHRLLRERLLRVPTLERDVSILLARDGDSESMRILRDRLEGRYDDRYDVLVGRAEMALALVAGGDRTYVAEIQNILRRDVSRVEARVVRMLGEDGARNLLSITQPSIESTSRETALRAAQAAMMIGEPAYCSRILDAGL